MPLRLEYQVYPFDTFTSFDDVDAIDNVRHRVSDSHPSTLNFTWHGPNIQRPIPWLAFVRLWDSSVTNHNGNPSSSSNPLFEGWVEDINPSDDGLSVEYTCYDPTRRASNQITVMSTAWTSPTSISSGSVGAPRPGTGAVPRLVFNCKTDNDPDYAFARENDLTVGQIIQVMLEDQYKPLYFINAAPGDGTADGNRTAYRLNTGSGTGAGTELAGMDFKPQSKMVFESESLRSAIARLMQTYAPNYRVQWWPGERQWRFYDIQAGGQVTLTLNDFTGTYKVLSYSLEPSLDDRHTAVRLVGPEATLVAAPDGEGDVDAFTTAGSAPTLVPLGSGVNLQTYTNASGSHQATAYTRWQIVDSTKRRGAKLLSRTVTIPMAAPTPDETSMGYEYIPVKSPCLQISFDHGATWMTVLGCFFDFQQGIVDAVNYIYKWVSPAPLPGSNQMFFPPTDVRLIWAYYTDPLEVRKPASGFEGTAYTVANLQSTMEQYFEDLAVGYEYGTPVTSAARVAACGTLAQAILDERKNIAYAGGCVLEGLQYAFARLNKRINFTSEDASGGAQTTGWEAINAILTDVEFDYTNQVTTLTFNSDQMALMKVDVENLKHRLKIRALDQVVSYSVFVEFRDFQTPYQKTGPLKEISGAAIVTHTSYVDPETGEVG